MSGASILSRSISGLEFELISWSAHRSFSGAEILGTLNLQHPSQRLITDAFILSWRSPRLEFELSCSVAPRSFSRVRALSQRSVRDAFILSWQSPRLEFRQGGSDHGTPPWLMDIAFMSVMLSLGSGELERYQWYDLLCRILRVLTGDYIPFWWKPPIIICFWDRCMIHSNFHKNRKANK